MYKKYLLGIVIVVACALTGFASLVHANPTSFLATVQTGTATTSAVYIVPGTATSTLGVFDSYSQGIPRATDVAYLNTQFAGSSTASILAINVEYSQGAPGLDCVASPLSCDWYKDNLNSLATSSAINPLNTTTSYSWTFASSTVGGIALTNANSATSTKVISIQTPLRYLRVIYSVTGGNAAVWGQIVPRRQAQ